jgi:hypothetical protein
MTLRLILAGLDDDGLLDDGINSGAVQDAAGRASFD